MIDDDDDEEEEEEKDDGDVRITKAIPTVVL